MPAYNYRAVDFSGRIARGHKSAANEMELAQNLGQAGFELIEARAKWETVPKQLAFRLQRGIDPQALAQFTSQITDLLRAGVNFPDAINDIARSTESKILREALDDIHRTIHHGNTIAKAFARHAKLFPEIFTAILDAGEKSGNLAATFAHLNRYAEARATTISHFRRAVRYPLFLSLVTIAVIAFMTTMVIPSIVQFLDSIDSQLPVSTRILIACSDAFANYWWAAGLAMAGIVLTLRFIRRYSLDAARAIDGAILKLPMLGSVFRKLAIARFAHSFCILYHSGSGILESLHSASGALGNRALIVKIEQTQKQIEAGRPLSAALEGVFPSFAIHMIRVGERSGKLGKALDDIAIACDREVNEATNKLIGAMEPVLTLLVGGVLAWIVLAVLGPIYGNIGKLNAMM